MTNQWSKTKTWLVFAIISYLILFVGGMEKEERARTVTTLYAEKLTATILAVHLLKDNRKWLLDSKDNHLAPLISIVKDLDLKELPSLPKIGLLVKTSNPEKFATNFAGALTKEGIQAVLGQKGNQFWVKTQGEFFLIESTQE